MFSFLVPLLIGFLFNLASAFTATYSHWWGEKWGTLLSALFRDFLGIPVWATGFCLAALAPSKALFTSTLLTNILGWALVAAGGIIIIAALASIRIRAAAPSARDALAETGLYAVVRHPIHSGTILEFVGFILVLPTLAVVLACLLGLGWVFLQTALEERDLLKRMPAYQDYMQRVPRYFPRFTRK